MPLSYRDRGSSGTQLDVMSGEVVVCSLWKVMLEGVSRDASAWFWTWRIEQVPPGWWQKHGRTETKEVAQAEIEQQWGAWLTAAGLTEKRGAAGK
jgi:hypothetical protein